MAGIAPLLVGCSTACDLLYFLLKLVSTVAAARTRQFLCMRAIEMHLIKIAGLCATST